MNMGGGILLRTFGRAAGSTTPAASTAFCSACTSQVPRPSSLRTICRACQNATLSHQVAGTVNPSDLEDWELADDFVSDNVNRSSSTPDNRLLFSSTSVSAHSSVCDETLPSDNLNWHVFGLPPTFDEAFAATSDLQTALFGSDIATDDDLKSTSSCSTPLDHEGFIPQTSNNGSDSEQESHSGEWVEPQLLSSNSAMVQVARSPVHEAFQLLQNDPNVKEVVSSIASDPDVWRAMMKNKKVQELRYIFEKSQGTSDELSSKGMLSGTRDELPSSDDNDDPFGGVFRALWAIVKMSRQVICQVQDDLSRFIMSVFSSVTRVICPSEKEDPIDQAVASTMMLAVLVVAVMLLKRLPA